jgi:hypothetical protein
MPAATVACLGRSDDDQQEIDEECRCLQMVFAELHDVEAGLDARHRAGPRQAKDRHTECNRYRRVFPSASQSLQRQNDAGELENDRADADEVEKRKDLGDMRRKKRGHQQMQPISKSEKIGLSAASQML